MTAGEVAKKLAVRIDEVVAKLLPQGKRTGKYWCVGSVDGEPGKSLRICMRDDKLGIWADFNSDEKGDLLDLWSFTRKISLVEAKKEACQWLGITEPQFVASTSRKLVSFNENKLKLISPNSKVHSYLTKKRCLTAETIKAFHIGEKNDYIIFPYYRDNKLLQIKYLHIERFENQKKIFVEKPSQPILFGWQAVPDNLREITLTEGELDAMSLMQYDICALSIPFGGGSGNKHQWIDLEFERLALFDKIYLCFDNDDTGKKTIEVVVERLGRHRCYIVILPEKDANACLQKGIMQETIQGCFAKAQTHDPEELKPASDYVNKVINGFYPNETSINGYSSPWEKSKTHIAFRPYELSIWTGINGHGKSQFLGFLTLHFMLQGARVCIASLEMKPERLLMRMTRQCCAFDLPTKTQIHNAHQWFDQKLWLFDLNGTAKTKRLLEVFLYARQRYGIDVFLIDSLLKCNIADDDYNTQKQFLDQLCDFKNEHPCHVHVVAHPRKSMDEDHVPGKLDIKGTGSISDLADNCFTIWRNKNKDDPNEADCVWSCHKQRNGEWEGKIALWFDKKSYQYLDHSDAVAKTIPITHGAEGIVDLNT